MNGEDSGVSKGPQPACTHRNPPSARFCDVCGVKLPAQCPRCHAVNRREANFCSSCGLALRDSPRAGTTPLSAPTSASTGSALKRELVSAAASLEAPPAAKRVSNEAAIGPKPAPAGPPRMAAEKRVEDEEAIEQIGRIVLERRRRRRPWLWIATAGLLIGVGVI